MNDIKLKIFELINKQEFQERIPLVNTSRESENPPETFNISDKEEIIHDEKEEISSDLDILESIEDIHFLHHDTDPSRHELIKLSDNLNMEVIENNLHRLQSQLSVVSKRLLYMILENQTSCESEFNKMKELCNSLASSLEVCQSARNHLHVARKSFTTASLGILSNFRKRKVIMELLKSLNTIKTLLQTEARLEELLREGDFSGAISILLHCQQAALTYRHFQCVAALAGKLQDTLVMAEEQLDVALAKICYEFNDDTYTKLQSAYSQLGKRRIAMDQLHMHFTSAIHSSVFNVIYHFAHRDNISNSKKTYAQLCKEIDDGNLIECLLELCRTLWNILRSYNNVVHWHNINQSKQLDKNFEQNIDDQYIKQKLESGLGKVWNDVQSRISLLITSSNVSNFKFDEFLQVLSILHKLVEVGEQFCGSNSLELQSSMKGQCSNYFRKYHISRLGELRLFLENEAWNPCPVKQNFNLLHLQEFRNLRYVVQNASLNKSHKRMDSIDRVSSGSSGYFSRHADLGTPFDNCELDSSLSLEEDILLTEDDHSSCGTDESDEEVKNDEKCNTSSHLSKQNVQKKSSILLTNTTITVLRHCGRYLQMSRLLRSITSDVIFCLRQLFEYYLYAVCIFFSSDLPDIRSSSILYSINKLHSILKRIEDNLIQQNIEHIEINGNSMKVLAPCISPMVDLSNVEMLYGLTERVVGVESLVLLADQFNLLRDYLEHLTDNNEDKHVLHLFYSQMVSMATEIRKPVYECVARKVVDSKNILNLMSKVNWEVKDVMCQHSQYIDVLLREFQIFVMRLENISSCITVPSEVTNCIWESMAEFLSEMFVEGFSNAKKCSNGGRALMQLDYTQLMSKLEVLSTLKPMPKREFVEAYVKAYYLPESILQNWITEHPEYSAKQLLALINCACSNNKKTRQKLTSIIEEMERR